MGSFLSRTLLMIFGYAFPAYECFKSVEKKKKNKPEIEQLQFWCQYWILVAMFTACERVGDAFISWLPMYSEAKLAFFIYLWHPKTKGTAFVYHALLRPYVANHETEIDDKLLKLKTKAREMGLLFWEEAAIYVQARFFDNLQHLSSRSDDESTSFGPKNGSRGKQIHQQESGSEAVVHFPVSPNNSQLVVSGESASEELTRLMETLPVDDQPGPGVSSFENGTPHSSKQEASTPRGKWRRLFRLQHTNKT